MIRLYAGFDPREEAGYHAFCSSVLEHASEPVTICPLHLPMLKKLFKRGQGDGSNAFTYARFLIPYLENYTGHALFMDGADMVFKDDIAKLWAHRDVFKAVQVVAHDYKTKHPRKYVGTRMESDNRDYPRKNWSSVMLINCAHYNWRQITPDTVEKMSGGDLHRFSFVQDRFVGYLPKEWNWLADEYGENPDAKVLHWTAGVPRFEHYKNAPMAGDWFKSHERANHVDQ